MKEMLIVIRMGLALCREASIKEKLLRHRHKMLDIYQKYQDCQFEHKETKEWRDNLKESLINANKEMQNWR